MKSITISEFAGRNESANDRSIEVRNRPAGKSGKDVMRHLGGGRANDRCELAEPTVGVMCGTFRRRIVVFSSTRELRFFLVLESRTGSKSSSVRKYCSGFQQH